MQSMATAAAPQAMRAPIVMRESTQLQEQQPLIERRILFHPARKPDSQHQSMPAGIEPLNGAPSCEEDGKSNGKRSWQMASDRSDEMDIALEWGPPAKIGAGLSNLGNTCFLNSVLQCLTYTPPLSNFLGSGRHQATCRNTGFCALCALEGHVKVALKSWGKVVSPNVLVKNLRCISRAFQRSRQEDAHEYLRYLLEAMHKASLPKNVNNNNTAYQEKSLMHKIFAGRLRSQLKCTVCNHCSDTFDPFLDLSLEINQAESLGKALARFTGVEILDGDNKYECSKCQKKVRALKRFTIETAPNILTIVFKRFSSFGNNGRKIDKKVTFGRTLDLKPFMSNPRNSATYELYGVLVHSGGSTHSGHYFCFVRTAADMWYVLDDSRVTQLSEKTVLEQKAYILFYMRKNPPRAIEPPATSSTTRPTPSPAPKPVAAPPAPKQTATPPVVEPTVATAVVPVQKAFIEEVIAAENHPVAEVKAEDSSYKKMTSDSPAEEKIAVEVAPETKAEVVVESAASIAVERKPEVKVTEEPTAEKPNDTGVAEVNTETSGRSSRQTDLSSWISKGQQAEVPADESAPVTSTSAGIDGLSQTQQSSDEPQAQDMEVEPTQAVEMEVERTPEPPTRTEIPTPPEPEPTRTEMPVPASPSRLSVSSTAEAGSVIGGKRKRVLEREVVSSPPMKIRNSPRKESDKHYLKLLRKMPKSRRFLLAKALENAQCENDKRLKTDSSPRPKMNGFSRPKMNGSPTTRIYDSPMSKMYDPPKSNGTPKPMTESSERPTTNGSSKMNGVNPAVNQPMDSGTEKLATTVTPITMGEPSTSSWVPRSSPGPRSQLFGDAVGRWEGVNANGIDDFLKTQHQTPNGRLDEWDEEYDRGKVKKVRRGAGGGRLSADGNPFQALASSKHK